MPNAQLALTAKETFIELGIYIFSIILPLVFLSQEASTVEPGLMVLSQYSLLSAFTCFNFLHVDSRQLGSGTNRNYGEKGKYSVMIFLGA